MSKKKYRPLIILIFILYILVLLYILLLKGNIADSPQDFTVASQGIFRLPSNYNLTPFKTIMIFVNDVRATNSLYSYLNLFGNIVLLIPFGFFVPLLTKRKKTFLLTFLTGTLFILLIEFVQLITIWGIFDIDDYLLNILGVLIGWIGQRIIVRR